MTHLPNRVQKNITCNYCGPQKPAAADVSKKLLFPSINARINGSAGKEFVHNFNPTANGNTCNGSRKMSAVSDHNILIDFTEDLLWSVSCDLKLITANHAFIEYLKDSAGIMVKPGDEIPLKSAFPPEIQAFWESCYRRALSGESFKEELFTPDLINRKAFWSEIIFNPIHTGGSIAGVACFSRNITERKTAEDRLKKALEEKNTILERIDDGFFAVDSDSVVTYWNKRAEMLLAVKRENIIGKKLHDVFSGSSINPFYNNYQKAIAENTTLHFTEFSIRTGKWFAVSAYASDNGLSVYFKDVTEQKTVEEKTKKSELRYRSLIEHATDAICITDASLRFMDFNESCCTMFGYSREELLKLYMPDVLFADDIAANPIKTESIQDGSTINTERRIKRKDGSSLLIELSCKMIEDGSIIIFGRDISERRKAEQLMKESEAKYRAFFESSMDGILLTVTDGEILSANPAACEIFKMTEEEICAAGRFGVADMTDPRLFSLIEERRRTGRVKGELTLLRKDGSKFEAELTSAVFTDSYGQKRTSMIVRDISERKKTEESLKESELRYRLLNEQATDAICITDAAMRFIDINPYGYEMLGYTREEALQLSLPDILFKEDLAGNPIKNKELKPGKTTRNERRIKRKDGSYLTMEVSTKLLEDGRMIMFGHDVSENKKAAQLIIESEAKYRTLFEQNMAGVYQSTPDGVIVNCNHAFAKMLKYDSPAELHKINASELYFSAADRIDFTDTVLSHKKLNYYESVLKCKDGSPLYIIENISLQKDASTGQELFNGIMLDITEKKQAEMLLKESNERFNLISMATNDMVWDWDLLTNKVYRSKEGWKKLLRTGDNETESDDIQNWDDRIHPDDKEKVKQITTQILTPESQKDFYEIECRVRRDDDTYVYVHDRGYIMRNNEGKAIRLIGATQDITKRKEAELQVAKSELRFRSLVQNCTDIICIFNDRGYFIYSNPAIKKMLGYKPEDTIEKNAFSFIHPQDESKLKDCLAQMKPGKYLEMPPFRFKNKAGEWRWLETKITDMSTSPEVMGYVFNSKDITDNVLLEKELEKERLAKQKEITDAVISAQERERQELGAELHDNVNQILAGSLLYLGLAKKELDTAHPYLNETDNLINTAIEEIRNLSHSLIAPSMHESEFLDAMKSIIDATQKTSGITVQLLACGFDESSIPDKLKLTIYRIVQEQISNILKHASASNVIVHLVKDNEKTLLSIKDDGVGFDTSKKPNGVGLMNIKTRASLFNGDIRIISSPGNGCELKVLFN